jgi:hypothetical protein
MMLFLFFAIFSAAAVSLLVGGAEGPNACAVAAPGVFTVFSFSCSDLHFSCPHSNRRSIPSGHLTPQ